MSERRVHRYTFGEWPEMPWKRQAERTCMTTQVAAAVGISGLAALALAVGAAVCIAVLVFGG